MARRIASKHAALVGLARPRNVECGSVVDRGANHGKANGNIHARFQSQRLDRPVALVVVHGDHQVEVAALGAEEERVGGQRALDIPSLCSAGRDGRSDLRLLLAVTEQGHFRPRAD